MEGYEIYRLSDEEIQHFGVKGMKWGKRKSRSSYMKKVDAHEGKTSARRDAKKAASKAKYEQEKADFANAKKAVKQAGKNYIERNKAKEVARLEKRVETKAKFKANTKTTINKFRDAAAMMEEEKQTKRDARKQLAKASIENYKKLLVKSLDDPKVKASVANSIRANNAYAMELTRTGANAHQQMFY